MSNAEQQQQQSANPSSETPHADPDGQITARDRYNAAVALISVSETTSWNRFNIFMALAAILIASWVQLYIHKSSTHGG